MLSSKSRWSVIAERLWIILVVAGGVYVALFLGAVLLTMVGMSLEWAGKMVVSVGRL
jgi:hypothetical protein